jgi:hypothetical protein
MKEQLRETEFLKPAISVGNISPKNAQYKNSDWPPLFYLETPSFEFFFTSDESNDVSTVEVDDKLDDDVVGSITEGNETVFAWHRKWLSKFPDLHDCTETYDKNYESEVTNKNDPFSVDYAEEWATYGNESRKLEYKSCKKTGGVKRRQLTTPPDQSAVNKLRFLDANYSQCELIQTPLRKFDDMNVTDIISAQVINTSSFFFFFFFEVFCFLY